MDIKQAYLIIKRHQQWRRGADIEMIDSYIIGQSIDVILYYIKGQLKQYDRANFDIRESKGNTDGNGQNKDN